MRWIVLLCALFFSTAASAQCSGVFPNNYMCGNNSGTPNVPSPIPFNTFTSAQIDAVCSTNNDTLIRLTGTWQCMTYSAQFTVGNTFSIASLAWSLITGTPTTIAGYGIINARVINTTATTFANNSTGSDANDCLAATVGGGHGPCATINHAAAIAKNTVDAGGGNSPVVSVATGTGLYVEQISVFGATVGGTGIQFTGTGSANITIRAPTGQYALVAQDYAGVQFTGFTFDCAAGALGEWLIQKFTLADVISDVKFSTCTGPGQINANTKSIVSFVGSATFTGNAGIGVSLASGAVLNASGGGCTITGAPTYSTAFLNADGSFVTFAAQNCSGAFTGPKFNFVGNSWAEANGVSFNTVIVGGSSGTLASGAQDDAGDNQTSPTPTGGVSCTVNTPAHITVVKGVVTLCN
jgi:hypothetical protein